MNIKKRNITIFLVICFIFSTELATTYLLFNHSHIHSDYSSSDDCEICYNVQQALALSRTLLTTELAIITVVASFLLVKKLAIFTDIFRCFKNLVSLKVKLSN